MRDFQSFAPARRSRGFILVTSLVFLVVITLLAVSAINSTTIQERMASNQREKSRARQASDATLRQAETLLNQSVFNVYRAPGETYGSTNTSNPSNTGSLHISTQDEMFPKTPLDESLAFLGTTLWAASGSSQEYTVDASMPNTRFYVEDMKTDFQPRDLNPDTRASGDGGVIYRITARAQGQNPAAISVTQSYYEKRY